MNLSKKTTDNLDKLMDREIDFTKSYREPEKKRSEYTLRDELIERGNYFISVGKFKKALDCYGNLIDIDNDYMGWYGAADAMAEMSMHRKTKEKSKPVLKEDAVICLTISLGRNINHYDSWFLLGNILDDMGYIGYSKICFEKWKELSGGENKA